MSKYLVETFYTCTFKITHKLDELNEKKLSELENRKDGDVQIIDVKLNNRKTKTTNKKDKIDDSKSNLIVKDSSNFSSIINEKIITKASRSLITLLLDSFASLQRPFGQHNTKNYYDRNGTNVN